MKISKLKTDFLEHLEVEQNRSQKTIANYDHYLTRLVDFAGDIDVSEIDGELIRSGDSGSIDSAQTSQMNSKSLLRTII